MSERLEKLEKDVAEIKQKVDFIYEWAKYEKRLTEEEEEHDRKERELEKQMWDMSLKEAKPGTVVTVEEPKEEEEEEEEDEEINELKSKNKKRKY